MTSSFVAMASMTRSNSLEFDNTVGSTSFFEILEYILSTSRMLRRYPKKGSERTPAPLFSGFYQLFRDLLILFFRYGSSSNYHAARKEQRMKRNPFMAGFLSLLVPGLGQIYVGKGNKGAAIIAASIVIGNLNIIILPLIAMANPVIPVGTPNAISIWAYWIPRTVHDVISFWSITFWVWAIVDATSLALKK